MNQIVHKFSLEGDKFMSEMHLRQLGFTYSACEPFTKNIQRIQKFMQTEDANYIYKNELDEACFQHDMAYGKYKDLEKRTHSDKVIKGKAFEVTNNPKYDRYQRGLASMVQWSISFLTGNQKELVLKMKLKKTSSYYYEQLNQLLENLKKEKCILFLKTIFGVLIYLIISEYKKGKRYLLCAIDLFSKYSFVLPLKDKKGTTIVNAFQSILNN